MENCLADVAQSIVYQMCERMDDRWLPFSGDNNALTVIVLQIARDLDIPIVETIIPREMLYIADEVFFTGTAAEVTPIRSVDRIQVGEGRRGPITERIQREFFGIVNGVLPDRYEWLTPVGTRKPVEVGH